VKSINTITSPPAAEPVHLDEMKLHLRIDGDSENSLLAALINAARQHAENVMARAIIAQTRKLFLDFFPGSEIALPGPPLIAVSSIQYIDLADSLQTLADSVYDVDTDSEPGRVLLAYSQSWPATKATPKAVTITYVCGYATPFTANATDDKLTWLGRTPVDGTLLRLTNSGGELPSPLAVGTNYYVVSASGQTCKLALAAGGVAIDILNAGSGTHFIGEIPAPIISAIKMRVGMLYENREGQADKNAAAAVENLLWPFRMMSF